MSTTTSNGAFQPAVFISHRNEDKLIANVIKDNLNSWANYKINVTQFTSPQHALRIGEPLNDELISRLEVSDLVILVYTYPDDDWAFCMYELGAVAEKNKTKGNTRVVVFSFSEKAPSALAHLVSVEYSASGLATFTEQFHKDEHFFPRLANAYAADEPPESISKKAEKLFKDLQEVYIPGKPEVNRWLFIKLKLELKPEELGLVLKAKDDREAIEVAKEFMQNCHVSAETEKYALQHVGYSELSLSRSPLSLSDVYENWCNEIKNKNREEGSTHRCTDWYSEIVREITRIIRNRSALEITNPMKSVKRSDNTLYLPVLNRYRNLGDSRSWEFMVELYRIDQAYEDYYFGQDPHPKRLNRMQAQKLNDIAIDRDLYKLYFRMCQKIDGENRDDVGVFVAESILDTVGTWNEFSTPFFEVDSLSEIYEMYHDSGKQMESKLNNILRAESDEEEKKRETLSVLRKSAISMKTHFSNSLMREQKGKPVIPWTKTE